MLDAPDVMLYVVYVWAQHTFILNEPDALVIPPVDLNPAPQSHVAAWMVPHAPHSKIEYTHIAAQGVPRGTHTAA